MIPKRFIVNTSTRISINRWLWMITTVISVLLGLGISQMVQLHEATAESQDDPLSELAAELDAIKAKHRMLQAKWQSELFAQIVSTLTDESNEVKREFVDFLEEIGSPGTPALVAMLRDPNRRVRQRAVEGLGQIGKRERKAGRNSDAVAIALATALEDSSKDVVREAVEELDGVRPTSPESLAVVVPALTAVQTVDSSSVRNEAVDVLGRIGEILAKKGESTDAIRDALIASLNDDSTKVRTNAIEELSDIRAGSAETFTALIEALSDGSNAVRARAEDVLIELGEDAAEAITPVLVDAFTNIQSSKTRVQVVDVLGAIGEELIDDGKSGEIVVKPILVALRDPAEDVRRNAADELGEMRATSPEVKTALTNALDDSSKAVRDAAKKAIRRIEGAK